MRRTKITFIINPISGTEGKQSIVDMIEDRLAPELFDCSLRYTERAGHASQLAKEGVAEAADIIVAVGGDGTVNEVARSITHSSSALGIIPCGSGNGLARHLAIPLNPAEALSIIETRHIETLDYGVINGHPFFCTCGVGFDAFVSERFANSDKRGLLSYVENTLSEGIRYKPETYVVQIGEESQSYEALLIACGNASQYGNNVYITPKASMKDGLLDVTIMEPFPLAEAPQIALQLFSKRITGNSHVRTFQCKHLKIHREQEGVVHFDGDPVVCGKDLDIRIVERGIRMVTNPREHAFSSPFVRVFADIFSDMRQEIMMLQEDVVQTNKRIRSINKRLLSRLRQR
ncbi:MAG: YegS/Rv2252/BmrU family lipid kinase [Prevotellaceae bacterium]|nr:YegS/Rv2252/BmrU family lipid kinase [Prevotellaceae bacterium]